MPKKLKGRPRLSGFEFEDDISRRVRELTRILANAQAELQAIDPQFQAQIAAIEENPDLTSEQVAIQKRQAREAAREKYVKLNAQVEKARRTGDELTRQLRLTRSVDPTVQQRVRGLLERRVLPSQIIDRARELRDGETLAALRAEVLYHGDRNGFVDTGETIHEVEQALADVGGGLDRERSRALLELEETAEPLTAVSEFAGKVAAGTVKAHDRLTVAYATGAGREGGDE